MAHVYWICEDFGQSYSLWVLTKGLSPPVKITISGISTEFCPLYTMAAFTAWVITAPKPDNRLFPVGRFICAGTLTEYPPSAEALIALDKSLFADGYRFANGRLVDVNQNIDTEVPAELEALPNNKALLEDLARNLSAKQLVVAEASATAERIRTKIDGLKPFGGTVKVTTSIGVEASETEGLSSPNALLDAADKAKYAAKFTTKNRICAWPLSPAEADAAATRKDGLAHSSESVLPRRTYARENGVS